MTSEVKRSPDMSLCYFSLVSHYTRNAVFEDVRVKIFQEIYFFKFLHQSDNELLVSEMKKEERNGGHRLRFRDTTCRKRPDFENSAWSYKGI